MLKKWIVFIALVMSTSFVYANSLQDDIDRATMIIRDFERFPENGIPESVLRNAKGLAILSVVKVGFIWSGRIGSGLVIAKTSDGWSAPSAIGVGGAGFGWQIGANLTEFVLVLNSQAAVEAFANNANISLGADLSVAAGPVGRTAEGSVMPFAAVYSYSHSQGLFAGLSLEGTVILERSSANREYYKKYVSPRDLLYGKIKPPKNAEELYDQLDKYSK